MSRLNSKTVLIGLLVLWGAVIAYVLSTHEPPRRVPKVFVSGKPAPRTVDPIVAERGVVRLDLIRTPPADARDPKRNIFSPIQVFIPKPPPRLPASTPVPTATPTDIERAFAAARAELENYKYIGYLDRGGKATAVISRGDEIFTVHQGNLIFGTVALRSVGPNQAVLVESKTGIETPLPLTNR